MSKRTRSLLKVRVFVYARNAHDRTDRTQRDVFDFPRTRTRLYAIQKVFTTIVRPISGHCALKVDSSQLKDKRGSSFRFVVELIFFHIQIVFIIIVCYTSAKCSAAAKCFCMVFYSTKRTYDAVALITIYSRNFTLNECCRASPSSG